MKAALPLAKEQRKVVASAASWLRTPNNKKTKLKDGWSLCVLDNFPDMHAIMSPRMLTDIALCMAAVIPASHKALPLLVAALDSKSNQWLVVGVDPASDCNSKYVLYNCFIST
jgi:hypothetical protein